MSKSYTSLNAGLLARKGEAVPATSSFNGENIISAHPVRRPLSSTSIPPTRSAWVDPEFVLNQAANKAGHSDKLQEVHESPPRIDHNHPAEKLPAAENKSSDAPDDENCEPCIPLAVLATGDDGVGRRSSVTFRLDATHYLCLKMAAAKLGRTNQDILTAALDMYLKSLADDALGDCTCLKQLIKGDTHVNHS